ncbi:homogentisate 1,2-dioxygenase [Rhodococcus sp. IITR03]|nr:homogentisate 1,2-dioxygenase [Rhodococcus sp. IITR03]
MPYFQRVGEIPRRRHTQFRQADSSLYHEELVGEEGFNGDSALLYHRRTPGAVRSVTAVGRPAIALLDNQPLLPRHLRCHDIKVGGDPVTSRTPLLGNSDVLMSYVAADSPSPLYRNCVGDELIYVEAGSAVVETVYGKLEVGRGDYVVIPTSVTHRWLPAESEPLRLLTIEARGHVGPPARYLSDRGQFLESAPFCELDLRTPEGPLLEEGTDVEVLYKRRSGWSRYIMASHPFDVVGWFGCMYPYAFNIWDFSPVTGSLHRPPPVHQTFSGPNFVICSFVPRLFDYHPDAVPTPPWHANVDSDEVLFYADGSFMSRKGSGIEQGSISLHPGGFIHGPHPGSVEGAIGVKATEETAVMLDTFAPLQVAVDAGEIEDTDYVTTWLEH